MSVDPSRLSVCVESLRHDGLISERFKDTEAADEWRAAMRRACRARHLRIRTFLVPTGPGKDDEAGVTAYVHHIDHVVTDAERRAVAEAMGDLVSGRPPVPFTERVRKAKREMMRVIPRARDY
jgi:hypothetical protein